MDFFCFILDDLDAAAAAKSLKFINWFENNMFPNEEAANELVLFVECVFLLFAKCCCSIKLTCCVLKKWWFVFAFNDDVVDVDEETDDDSKAAGVSNNGNVVGDIGGSDEAVDDDLDEVDEDVDEDLEDLDDNVDAADDEEWCDEAEFDEEDEYCFKSLLLLLSFLLLNVKWFGLKIRLEPESPK